MKRQPHGYLTFNFLSVTAVLFCLFLPNDALRITPPHLRVREGRPATLICWTNDRRVPTGGITWSGPHGRMYGPASSPIGDRVRAANHFLYITNANRSDHGSYRCTSVATGTQSPATVVEVTKPPTIRNQMPIQPIHLHQTSLIRCDVDLGYPTSTVIWYKNHIRIIPNERITITGSGLQIQNVQQSDEGLYECYAYNSEGVASLNITVTFRAPPQFLQNNNNTAVEIRQGGPIELDCSAVGAPQPNYTWTVPPGSNGVPTGPILRIPFTNAGDMGMYKCNASNELGAIQKTFNVNVYVPPTPTLAHHNHTISLGHSVTLNCSVQAQPSPTYTWFHYDKQSRREFPITDLRYTKLQNGSLHISNVQLSDFNQMDCIMLLLCSADNAFGVSKQYYTITPKENECVISTDTPTNSPSTQPTSISTSSSESRSSDSGVNLVRDPAPTDPGQQPFLIPLVATFAAILFLLFLVVLAVVVYLIIICRHKKRSPKPSIETGSRHTTAVTPRNSRLPSTTTLINSASIEPPPPPFPPNTAHNNGTTQSYLHPRGSIDSVDSGGYSKLNHHLPNRQRRLESTSSASSNAPLLASCSSVEEDSPFSPGYSHIVPPANQEGSQTSRCGNCNRPIDTSPHVLNQTHHPIDTSQPNQTHHPIDTNQPNQMHHPIDTSQPNQTPAYLQLRGETRNPPAVYEIVS